MYENMINIFLGLEAQRLTCPPCSGCHANLFGSDLECDWKGAQPLQDDKITKAQSRCHAGRVNKALSVGGP